MRKILVTGGTGFLGRHLIPVLKSNFEKDKVFSISRKNYDLMNPEAWDKMFETYNPDILIHLAAYSGGIGANKDFPADFYFINTILTAYGFHYASKYKVKKMIYTMGGCSYPATAKNPISEEQMWEGFPQKESSAYSIAKKTGIIAGISYNEQNKLNNTVIVPGNMYGEYDNYKINESHVIPGMIRRYYEAKINNLSSVKMWGTGSPVRDFVYAGDIAKMISQIIDFQNIKGPINLSSGQKTSIHELAYTISKIIKFKGKILWDVNKPDGQLEKVFSIEKMKKYGLEAKTDLNSGLNKTISWFIKNYNKKSDGIRL